MNKLTLTILTAALSITSAIAQDMSKMDQFITNLMSRMTIEEKIGQMNQLNGGDIVTGAPTKTKMGQEIVAGHVGSVLNTQGVEKIRAIQETAVKNSRLGIPILVGLDVIHGHETLFPIPLGLASTWDMEAIRESARIAAIESTVNGINWTFSPMVDICLDSRWGRMAESAGEDPYLGSCVAKAMVEGYEKNGLLSCVKHFALYGAAEAGRDYNSVDMSRVRMYNQYLAPYKAALDAGAGSVMTSFNIIDGMPATGNRWLLTDLLRKEWGFKGFVVTDYATIPEMRIWGTGTDKENAARAINAGTDMDMVSECFMTHLPQLLKENKVTEADIDKACRRILEAKYKLGLFDNPYKCCDKKMADKLTYSKAHREIARRITQESFVLLKNDNNLLPLSKHSKIALIGPMADNREDIAGTWSFSARKEGYKTLREAMEEALKGKGTVLCTQGCNTLPDAHQQETVSKGHGLTPVPRLDDAKAMEEALAIAREADVIVCAMGESAWMNGEGTSRADLEMPQPQRQLLKALHALNKPVVLLNFSGRGTAIQWEAEHLQAIMNVWYGSECGDALCDVLFGDAAPSGHLTVSMPKATGQEPLFYNHLNTGRPVPYNRPYSVFASNYIDVTNGPLFPFGYGLTYTTFQYGKPQAEGDLNNGMTLSVDVTNIGKREGDEVVQLYIRDEAAQIARPVMELKGFKRIHLKAGETQKVTFTVTRDMLSYYNQELQWTFDPGTFQLMVGPDSKNTQTLTLDIR